MKFSHVGKIQSLAIVGATGLVGKEFLEILAEHKIKIGKIKLLASGKSAGESVDILDTDTEVEELTEKSFEGVEVAFFSIPNEATKKFVPIAAQAGCLVVDDSSVFRMVPEVPLIIPQVNGNLLRDFDGKIIATPNCSTTPVALCLKPLHEKYGLERVVCSTYQSVSGAGKAAYDELSKQTAALLNGKMVEPKAFAHQIAFNCLPLIGSLAPTGNTEEEEKVIRELRKILDLPELRVSATAIRVPTFCGHGVSVNVELQEDVGSIEEVRELMDGFPGIKVLDKPDAHIYPTNMQAIGADLTFVGRIRKDTSVPSGINFYVIADNLRKGAALNVIETLDALYNYRSMS